MVIVGHIYQHCLISVSVILSIHCSSVIHGYADPPLSPPLPMCVCVCVIIIFHFSVLLRRWRGGDSSGGDGGGGDDGLNGTLSTPCPVYFISFAKSLPTAKSHFFSLSFNEIYGPFISFYHKLSGEMLALNIWRPETHTLTQQHCEYTTTEVKVFSHHSLSKINRAQKK